MITTYEKVKITISRMSGSWYRWTANNGTYQAGGEMRESGERAVLSHLKRRIAKGEMFPKEKQVTA